MWGILRTSWGCRDGGRRGGLKAPGLLFVGWLRPPGLFFGGCVVAPKCTEVVTFSKNKETFGAVVPTNALSMARPRSIKPNTYYFIARHCMLGLPLLRPSRIVNIIFLFCLIVGAAVCNIGVVGFSMTSTQYYAVFYDRDGVLPAFLRDFHRCVAVVMNCFLGRRENFWAVRQTTMIECADPQDVLDKLVAVLTLPVTSHLVERAKDWSGASSLTAKLHFDNLTFKRPAYFFSKVGRMPPSASLTLVRPKGFEHLTDEAFAKMLDDRIEQVEREVAAKRATTTSEIPPRATQSRRPSTKPRKGSNVTEKSEPLTVLRSATKAPLEVPITSAGSTLLGVWTHVKVYAREKLFRKRYAKAYALLQQGVRDVLFPAGTYRLRVRNLVNCEPFPNSG